MATRERPVTQSDVAKAAGVSRGLVSQALSGGGRMSPSTRAHVLETAEKLGYYPHSAASELAGGHSKRLVLILPYLTNPYFDELSSHLRVAASARGYSLIVMVSDLTSHGADLAQYVVAHRLGQPITDTFIKERPIPTKMGVGHSGFEIGDEAGPIENEDYVAALVRFDNGAVGTLANPAWGQWAHFQPAIGTSMGFDDMKVIEAQQFLSSIATSTQLAPLSRGRMVRRGSRRGSGGLRSGRRLARCSPCLGPHHLRSIIILF